MMNMLALLQIIITASLGTCVMGGSVVDEKVHDSYPRISMLRKGAFQENSLSSYAGINGQNTDNNNDSNYHIITFARSPGMQPTDPPLLPSQQQQQQQQTHRQTQGKNNGKEATQTKTKIPKAAPIKVVKVKDINKKVNKQQQKNVKNKFDKNDKNDKKKDKNTVTKTTVPSVMVTTSPTSAPTPVPTPVPTNPSVIDYTIFTKSPTMSNAPTLAPSVTTKAKPMQIQTIELSMSIGVKNSGIRDASSALINVIETSNLAENSEQALQDTFIKLRKAELLKTSTEGLMTLLNDEVDNLIVRPNTNMNVSRGSNRSLLLPEQESKTDNYGIRDLKQTRIAKFIVLGNKQKDSTIDDAGDNVSSLGLDWFHVKFSYSLWYEVIAYEHESDSKLAGRSVLPEGLDKESLKALEIEEFLATDTDQLLKQLNDVIARSIASQKLAKLLHEDDDSIVSVSQIGQEQSAILLSVPVPPGSDVSVDEQGGEEVPAMALKELSPFQEPLNTKRMTSTQTSGLVLFLMTILGSFFVYKTANYRQMKRAEQYSVSLSSQQGMESILANSRNLPHYLNHIVTHQQDRNTASPGRSSLASSRLSSTISSRVDEDKQYLHSTPTRSRLKHPKIYGPHDDQSPYDERSTSGSSYHQSTQVDDSSYKYTNDMESVKEERDLEIL